MSDRDLRLAQRLDAGLRPDGSDGLHDALDALAPGASSVAPEASARLWAAVASETGVGRPAAPDRSAARPAVGRRRPAWRRLAVAAAVVLAAAVTVWQWGAGPDLVAAAASEAVTVDLPDGSTVTLRPHSRLVRDEGERAYGLEGEAYFAVAPDPSRPFTVEAGDGAVRVLGTRFDVSTWTGRTEVFVEEGRVEVTGGASALVLAAGEAAAATSNGVAPLPDVTAASALDWRRGEAVFQGERAERVADEVGQHFGVRVDLPPDVARQRVSGVLPLVSAPAALDGLGRILGGQFVSGDDGFRFVR